MNETERKKLQYEELKKYIYTTSQSRRNTDTPGVIPAPYRFIDEKCFMNNGKVHAVVLPESCKVIGKQAFDGCKNLKKVVIRSNTLKSIGSKAFAGINKKAVIQVPKKKYKAYLKLMKKAKIAKNVKIKKS